MSEIGKAVNNSTHLSYSKIVASFRYHMDLALYSTFRQDYATESILETAKRGDTTLAYIYSSVGYKYDLLSANDSSGESHAEFDTKKQKTHFIHNGQLQVPMDYSKRFINVSIANPNLLNYLNKKHHTDIIVFINELDIRNVPNPTENLNESNIRREATVQYSIVNTQHHYLAKGILTIYFPYNENDPKAIGEKYFTAIAHSMETELVKGLQKQNNKSIINHTSKTKK